MNSNIRFSQVTVNGMKVVTMTKSSILYNRKKTVISEAKYPANVKGE